jgi:hypothetical protein
MPLTAQRERRCSGRLCKRTPSCAPPLRRSKPSVYIKRHEKSRLTAVPSARIVELPGLGPVKISRRQTG